MRPSGFYLENAFKKVARPFSNHGFAYTPRERRAKFLNGHGAAIVWRGFGCEGLFVFLAGLASRDMFARPIAANWPALAAANAKSISFNVSLPELPASSGA